MNATQHQQNNQTALKKPRSKKNTHHFTDVHDLPCIEKIVCTVSETPHPIQTNITGKFPEWINGSFLRNGPGKFEIGNQKFNHWFDGMALLHQFKISKGQVTYRSRFLSSDSYQANNEKNRIVVSEFGTVSVPDPCKNFFQRFLSRFELPKHTDNANVSVVTYKGDYYVSTESNIMHKINPETLEATKKFKVKAERIKVSFHQWIRDVMLKMCIRRLQAKFETATHSSRYASVLRADASLSTSLTPQWMDVNWRDFIAVNSATAHPHVDVDGTTYNMGNSFSLKGSYYNIIQVPQTKYSSEETLEGAKVLCSIPSTDSAKPSYYHSFAMSENYVVFIEQPLKMDLLRIVTGKLTGKSVSDSFFWDPKLKTIFHLVLKKNGKVSSFQYLAQPLTTLHQINAFEEDGHLIIDMCVADDGQIISNYNIQNLRKSGEDLDEVYNTLCRIFPRRFVLPLNVDDKTPYDQNLNGLPHSSATSLRIAKNKIFCTHEDLHGEDLHEYGGLEFPQINYGKYNTRPYRYFYGCGFRHLVGDTLIKMDIRGKHIKVWEQPGLYPSEPVFVPSPDATEEDDGVILSVVITPNKDKSTFLLALDAKTFEELGRADVPVNIPYGFHGTFNATA